MITQEVYEYYGTYDEAISIQNNQAHIAGFSDWFLPDAKEMKGIYSNLFKNSLGVLKTGKYWISRYPDKMDKENHFYRSSDKLNKYLVFNFETGNTEEVDPMQKCLVRLARIDVR